MRDVSGWGCRFGAVREGEGWLTGLTAAGRLMVDERYGAGHFRG